MPDTAAGLDVAAVLATARHRLDVRPILARGDDPFAQIMTMAQNVAVGEVLLLDAPFDPTPLKRVLARRGFSHATRHAGAKHWQIAFRRDSLHAPDQPASRQPGVPWEAEDGFHVDVRGLPPPEPMVRILELLDSARFDSLLVHHDREPRLLYPELAERGWEWQRLPATPPEVLLRLQRI